MKKAVDQTKKMKLGSGFLGCLSFGLQDLLTTAPEEMPRWYWLLSKTQGLSRFKPVEHALAGVGLGPSENLIRVDGRKPSLANSFVRYSHWWTLLPDRRQIKIYSARLCGLVQINGYYMQQAQLFAGRPTFKHEDIAIMLYFHPGRGVWAIGDAVGSSAPYAFVEDEAYNAGQ